MANRRCLHTLTRHYSLISSSKSSLQSLKSLPHIHQTLISSNPLSPKTLADPKSHRISTNLNRIYRTQNFCSHRRDESDESDEEEDEEDEEEEVDDEDEEIVSGSTGSMKRAYTPEEKAEEAAAIGYKVVGPLERSDRVFKLYEPVFAVVQIGSHQFKVSNGDCIYTERLKFCEVNEKLILNKVLMLGSATQTIIGRPILPDAAVHAVVEEHALDAKVIIFKKKRRKNYRRTKGHRQELTKLRITDIQGIEKPEEPTVVKTKKASSSAKEVSEKVAVPA